jgi:hypothetical protein
VDEAPRLLPLEVRCGGACNIEAAGQVDVFDDVPVLGLQFVEDAVTKDAGVVYDRVDAPERRKGIVDDRTRALPARHAVEAWYSLAADCFDLVGDDLSDAPVLPFALRRTTEIVDDYPAAVPCDQPGDSGADAAACARHHDHSVFQQR